MGTRPPEIKVGKASGGSNGGGPVGLYQGGLGRTQKVVDEREKEREEQRQEIRLNPKFPYSVVEFDPAFFNIPAAPVVLPDGDEKEGGQ